jgi:Tfp pilus assembly PilM family ATPase
MAKKPAPRKAPELLGEADPAVAATLTEIIYQAKLFNRQARVAVPEEEVVTEVISLWRIVMNALKSEAAPGV